MNNPDELVKHILLFSESVAKKEPLPYILNLSNGSSALTLIGVEHTKDPSDYQIPAIKKTISDFLEAHHKKPIIIGLEGGIFEFPETNEGTAIQDYGERALLILEAHKKGIPVQSVEPAFNDIFQDAEKLGNTAMDMASWGFLNTLSTMISRDHIPREKISSLEIVLTSINNQFGVLKPMSSPADIYESLVQHLKDKFVNPGLPEKLKDLADSILPARLIKDSQDSTKNISLLNRVAEGLNLARDFGLLKNILALTKDHDVLIMMGDNHVIAQEPAFLAEGFIRTTPN
jgi:hypothetical protein